MKRNQTPLTTPQIARLQARYQALSAQLAQIGPVSQGSVMPQPPRAWRWTRKVAGKTVSTGLSPTKAALMQQAIANHREMDAIIDQMRLIAQKLILEAPEPPPDPRPKNRPKQALT